MIASKKITAHQMGLAVLNDPQFKLPERPLFSNYFTLIPHMEDGLIIDGGIEKQLLRGKATKTLIPELIPLLDGTRTILELTEELPEYSPRNIYEAIALLYTRGVIQEGYQKMDSGSPYLPYLERFIDGTRINSSAGQALDRLLSFTINVISTQEIYTKLEKQFSTLDMKVKFGNSIVDKDGNQITLLVLKNLSNLEEYRDTLKELTKLKVPCFLAILQGSTLITGPYFDNDSTMCFECFLEQLERIPSHYKMDKIAGMDRLHEVALSYVAGELTNFLSKVSSLLITQNMINIVDLTTLSGEQIKFSKVPYCKGCDGNAINQDPVIDIVSQYESFVTFPPREFISIKDHQNHYRPKNLELAKFFKEFNSFPFIKLENESSLPDTAALKNEKDGQLLKLAKILLYSNGLKAGNNQRQNQVNRYAPTGGNLGSVDMYFINTGIKDLDRAVFFYDPLKHGLSQITEKLDDDFLDETIEGKGEIETEFTEHFGYIVLAGSYEKVAQKYKEFGYRIVNLDAGAAFTHIQASSQAMGLRISESDRFIDDNLKKLLKINRRKEMITYLIAVGKRSDLDD
jgi:SagB-type dehydrogenase family enzyme